MSLENAERRQLMTRSRWRLPALPAGKSAFLRGLVVTTLLFVALFPVVPFGPEMIGTTSILTTTTSLDGPMAPALSSCKTLVALLSVWLHPFVASACLSIVLVSLLCGVCVCWLRQLDAARSVVIPAALLLGLSPAITEVARHGGSIPLSLLLGTCLMVATEQLRSEAGRGMGSCGLTAGLAIASGPLVIPALLYSLLSLICDQSVRDIRFRSLLLGVLGLVSGFALLMAVASYSDPEGFTGVIEGFLSDWSPHIDVDLERSVVAVALIAGGTGLVLGALAIFGVIYGATRRPGDLALMLTMASSGPLMLLVFGSRSITPLHGSAPFLQGSILFSLLTMTLLASWTLTVTHRRLGKKNSRSRQWVAGLMLILIALSLAMRSPDLLRSRTELVTQWSRSVLMSLPMDSLLLTGGSPLASALSVVQLQEGLRPDVIILDRAGDLDPVPLGLAPATPPPRTLQVARGLVAANRPLLALSLALHHPLLSGRQLSAWGLLLIAHDPGTPAPDDSRAWLEVDISDLPQQPSGAWRWIRGEGPVAYGSGRMAAEVAAGSWFAIARREGQLRGDGNWSAILGLLGNLMEDPISTRRWARQQPADLIGPDATSRGPRISD